MHVSSGFSLLELVVVVAILGILAGLAFALARPASARHAAVAVASELTAARLRALAGGAPTAVTLSGSGRIVERRVAAPGTDAPDACAAGTVDRVLDLADYPGARVASGFDRGIVWFPSGWGRSCDGGGVYNGRIVLRDPRSAFAVIVSSAGRVRWEAVE